MKVSLNWLRDYVDVKLSPEEIAHRLTMAGLEVEAVDNTGEGWENVVVGQVLGIEPHPAADKLRLATIDKGTEQIKVICGAPNLQIGDKIAFAGLGANLIDPHTGERAKLKKAKIRGVVSEGMVCSEMELGISESHEGILVLPPEAPLGVPLADYMGDSILDIAVTPNRPDCLSMIGVAREVAALTELGLHVSSPDYEEKGKEIEQSVSVEIADPDLCRRYCASLIKGIKIGPSPEWLQQRLIASGMRPISNIVDITNYVMLEYGQPLHAFDFNLVGEGRIIVRRAGDGEHMVSLDDVERNLNPEMLVIADNKVPVAIAGVMGGAGSEVSDATTTILLESANFNPVSIRHTSSNLKLRSEASMRFERKISPELTIPALKRATQLMLEIAGGEAAKGIIDVYPGKEETEPVLLTVSQVKRLLGIDLEVGRIGELLSSLGFESRPLSSSELEVTVPYWRVDVLRPADLVEEIARVIGYDKIPMTMLSSQLVEQQPDPLITLKEQLSDLLVGCGFQEAITYPLTSQDRIDSLVTPHTDPLRVFNPLSSEQEFLRLSLLPNLLAALAANQRQAEGGIRFFEIGKVFMPRGEDLPEEKEMLAGLLSGLRDEPYWMGESGQLDFFDAKGVVETLLERMGIEAVFQPVKLTHLHPGRAAEILVDGVAIGNVGELNPQIAEKNFDLLPQPVALFELEVGKLLSLAGQKRKFSSLSRFPESMRDLAVVVDDELPASKVSDIISGFPLVSQVSLFDLYTGEQVPSGKKSLAFRVVYKSPDRTLTDEEVDKVEGRILARLSKELEAKLRG